MKVKLVVDRYRKNFIEVIPFPYFTVEKLGRLGWIYYLGIRGFKWNIRIIIRQKFLGEVV